MHFLSINDFTSPGQVIRLFERARSLKLDYQVKDMCVSQVLKNRIVATVFHERSTRTKSSFEAAVYRMGGNVINETAETSSAGKGESLQDTLRTISCYCDMIVCRHPEDGLLQVAAKAATVPVINAGDGANEHPTQALLDWFTIWLRKDNIENLNIMLTGDLMKGRTIRSFLQLGKLIAPNARYFLANPSDLRLSVEDRVGIHTTEVVPAHVMTQFPHMDVLYVTRIQAERYNGTRTYKQGDFRLRKDMLDKLKETAMIMHPGPRTEEIDTDVDTDPRALYHTEMPQNGLMIRMALLQTLINGKLFI